MSGKLGKVVEETKVSGISSYVYKLVLSILQIQWREVGTGTGF